MKSVPDNDKIDSEKLKLEFKRLEFERSKLAIKTRRMRRENQAHGAKSFREAFSNPLMIAVVGGALTLLTSIITNYLAANANRDADERRATQTREAESRNLQSELIKTFLTTQDSKIARDNLTFLIESGLIPDHEKRISEYLEKNKKTVPKISDTGSKPSIVPLKPPLEIGTRKGEDAIGVSLHIGANRLDPNTNGGFDFTLPGVLPDTKSMQQLSVALGYRANILTDTSARADFLLSALDTLSATLRRGDTLFVTISGHGSQEPDETGTEPDKLQEFWILFDRPVSSRELYERFAQFKEGVTIIVVEDVSNPAVFRRPPKMPALPANLVVLAGAKEDQYASDGEKQGRFTESLLKVWADGKFSGSYDSFMEAVRSNMPGDQTPQLYIYSSDESIRSRKPFAK